MGPIYDMFDQLTGPKVLYAAMIGIRTADTGAERAGPITVPGIRYAVLATRDDTTNTPAGVASFTDEPGVDNEFIQDLRPGAVAHTIAPRSHGGAMDTRPAGMTRRVMPSSARSGECRCQSEIFA
ncbi:hypothetical protein [Nocardia acidivorans]|uniref:hypothetical protein n=1 Tax=Nocardia acidivorans TaxID=404580 RepID=UPI0012FC849B|nr:hypothetical protein [Nocardia acidivorans]